MRKIFALIISLMTAAVLFAACGDNDVYERPGTGTTLEPDVTTVPPETEENGSYSAAPDGDVNLTSDDGMLEEGMDDIRDGALEGAEDIGEGLEDLGGDIKDGAEDMGNGSQDANNGAGTSRTDEGDSHGSVGGNSR